MWEVVWLIAAKLHSHPPGHFTLGRTLYAYAAARVKPRILAKLLMAADDKAEQERDGDGNVIHRTAELLCPNCPSLIARADRRAPPPARHIPHKGGCRVM